MWSRACRRSDQLSQGAVERCTQIRDAVAVGFGGRSGQYVDLQRRQDQLWQTKLRVAAASHGDEAVPALAGTDVNVVPTRLSHRDRADGFLTGLGIIVAEKDPRFIRQRMNPGYGVVQPARVATGKVAAGRPECGGKQRVTDKYSILYQVADAVGGVPGGFDDPDFQAADVQRAAIDGERPRQYA